MKFLNARTFIAVGILLLLAGSTLGVVALVRKPQLTPALRGSRVAETLGCFACHGPGGTGGIPNPGSDEEEIPAWNGGNAMTYVKNEQEIREWILYGHPKRLKSEREESSSGESDDHGHDSESHGHDAQTEVEPGSLPLRMPAFDDLVSGRDLDDLVAYYKAVAAFEALPSQARAGYRVASRLGCFGCHGPGGRVGAINPRSFKGYIPPWQGKDYAELVKDDDELREWILEGRIERFESNPVARYFTRRQTIQMPEYRNVLRDGELEALVEYIEWLNRELL